MGLVEDCEDALAAHWSQLGRLPGGTLHREDGLVWFETPVRHLPYNGVVRTRLAEPAADAAIARVLGSARERGAELWWVAHPSATPRDLGARLAAAGMRPVERMNFMALDLAGWEPLPAPPGVTFEVAEGEVATREYTSLTFSYWDIPEDEHAAVAALHRAILPGRFAGARFLARLDGRAVGKAYLSLPGPPGVASLYGMSVVPEARGRGVAAGLTAAMVAHALELGCHRAVLHATDVAVGVYRRVGFARCATAPVYATTSIWS